MMLFRRVLHICAFSFYKLSTNYRLWIAILLLLVLTHAYTKDYAQFCVNMNIKMSPWIFPFLYSSKYVKILFFAPLILLFCDAPFVDQSQPYVILRSKRVAWSLGQILYIVALSALYFLFLFLISNLFIFSHVDFSLTGWGKVLGTLANTSAAQEMGLLSFIDSRTLYYFTPLQAVWFTFLLSWLVGVFLGLTIYLLNSATQTRIIGVLIATSFLILDSVITGIPQATWLSPVSWSTLNHVGIGAGSQYPPIGYIYGGFAVLIITLLVLSVAVNRRQDINVVQPV